MNRKRLVRRGESVPKKEKNLWLWVRKNGGLSRTRRRV